MSRAYYAALHVARALLLTEDIEPQTHAGVSAMLGMHFVVPGRLNAQHAKELAEAASRMIEILSSVVTNRAPRFRVGRAYWHRDKSFRRFEACFLPLSENQIVAERHLGTRHRAAIGITRKGVTIAPSDPPL